MREETPLWVRRGLVRGGPLRGYGRNCEGRDPSCANEGICEGVTPKEAGRGSSLPAWQQGLLVCIERSGKHCGSTRAVCCLLPTAAARG